MKRVSIVGKGHTQRYDQKGEVWGLNAWNPKKPCRATRWFQMHPYVGRDWSEEKWLKVCPVPIYILKQEKGIKASRVYPLSKVPQGPFCSSFDYMMALAITEKFTHIDLYGVDLQTGTARERLCEHSSLAYWVGMARGRGITVTIHGKGFLHIPYKYGYDYQRERTWGQRRAFEAALFMLNFKYDDGAAKVPVRGWKKHISPGKVAISI